jgi:hypothetical protein
LLRSHHLLDGLFSVPAPLFDELARSSAGFFRFGCPFSRKGAKEERKENSVTHWSSWLPLRLGSKKIFRSSAIFVAFAFAFS